MVSWVFFRSASVTSALQYLGTMIGVGARSDISANHFAYITDNILWWILAIVFIRPIKLKNFKNMRLIEQTALVMITLVSVIIVVSSDYNPFIYFNF